MTQKYLMVSLDDEKSKSLSEVLASKTCKKIIDYLSEEAEASQKDLSDNLKIPLNTIGNNIKKLISTGIVEKTQKHFWSVKGKKILTYKLSNKQILISPKSSKLKSVLPVALISGALAFLVHQISKVNIPRDTLITQNDQVFSMAEESAKSVGSTIISSGFTISPGIWFLSGAVVAVIILILFNWRKL